MKPDHRLGRPPIGAAQHVPYRLVRHPLMTGLLLCFWCASTFTVGHLLWAAGLTSYILLGTFLEERDLVARFGATYRSYASQVPAFFPSPFPSPSKLPTKETRA